MERCRQLTGVHLVQRIRRKELERALQEVDLWEELSYMVLQPTF
ncbi:hypothetical protein [Spirosoma pulveris]